MGSSIIEPTSLTRNLHHPGVCVTKRVTTPVEFLPRLAPPCPSTETHRCLLQAVNFLAIALMEMADD